MTTVWITRIVRSRSRRRGSCSFRLHPPSTETAVCGFMLWKCDSVGTCDFGGGFVLYYYVIRGFIIIINFFFFIIPCSHSLISSEQSIPL